MHAADLYKYIHFPFLPLPVGLSHLCRPPPLVFDPLTHRQPSHLLSNLSLIVGLSNFSMISSTPRCSFHLEVRYRCTTHSTSVRTPLGNCARRWRTRCAHPIPLPTGEPLVLLSATRLSKLHATRKCPCWYVGYGGITHRWCTGTVHLVDAQLVRKHTRMGAQADSQGLIRLQGKVQTRITDYYMVVKN